MLSRKLSLVLALLLCATNYSALAATTADINSMRERALAYLFLNQDADGFWDGPGKIDIQATSQVLQAYQASGIEHGISHSVALSWLANSYASSITVLDSQIGSIRKDRLDVTDQLLVLVASTNDCHSSFV